MRLIPMFKCGGPAHARVRWLLAGIDVMHWIDREIARATNGQRALDDAVREVVRAGGVLSTASFLRAVNRVAGHDLTPLFQRHVHRGAKPPLSLPGGGDLTMR